MAGQPSRRAERYANILDFSRRICVQNGIIYNEWKVIIPKSMRSEMLEKIHKSHLGIAASIQKTRDVMC